MVESNWNTYSGYIQASEQSHKTQSSKSLGYPNKGNLRIGNNWSDDQSHLEKGY